MEYYYNKLKREWKVGLGHTLKDEEKIKKLRDQKLRKKLFFIVDNLHGQLYPGINTNNIYFDKDDFRLIIDGNKLFLANKTLYHFSRTMLKYSWIKNIELLEKCHEDLNYVVSYVEDVSYLGHGSSEELKNKVIMNNYYSLSPEAQLYYQMEGNRLDLI